MEEPLPPLTSDEINPLPEPLRRYIRDLETNCDPSGLIQENWALRWQNAALQAQIATNLLKITIPTP